jgi:hypothetical protein
VARNPSTIPTEWLLLVIRLFLLPPPPRVALYFPTTPPSFLTWLLSCCGLFVMRPVPFLVFTVSMSVGNLCTKYEQAMPNLCSQNANELQLRASHYKGSETKYVLVFKYVILKALKLNACFMALFLTRHVFSDVLLYENLALRFPFFVYSYY